MKINGVWLYAGGISVRRDYLLFGLLADVRNDDGAVECITESNREIPENASDFVNEIYERGEPDYHSASYLTWDELLEAKKIYEKEAQQDFPESIMSLKNVLDLPFVEDVRFVFWFDN